MATTGLVNLAESLLNQTATAQELQALPATNGTGTATAGAVNTQAILDEFVPSSQTGAANATAEAAGLFTAAQIPLFTAAANSLLSQSTPAQSTPAQVNLAVAPGNTVAPLVPPLVSLVEGTAQIPIQTIATTPAPAAATPAAATLAAPVAGVQAGTNGNATAATVAPVATTQQPARQLPRRTAPSPSVPLPRRRPVHSRARRSLCHLGRGMCLRLQTADRLDAPCRIPYCRRLNEISCRNMGARSNAGLGIAAGSCLQRSWPGRRGISAACDAVGAVAEACGARAAWHGCD